MDINEHMWAFRCQWAGEDKKPFPKLPEHFSEKAKSHCRDRYRWQMRRKNGN